MSASAHTLAGAATLTALASSFELPQVAHAQRILPSHLPRTHPLDADSTSHVDSDAASRELRADARQQTDDLVRDLPGLDPSIKITHHAGRIGLRSDARNNIFYWHFPASKSPETAPLVIWCARTRCDSESLPVRLLD